jgi:hypothetical protein
MSVFIVFKVWLGWKNSNAYAFSFSPIPLKNRQTSKLIVHLSAHDVVSTTLLEARLVLTLSGQWRMEKGCFKQWLRVAFSRSNCSPFPRSSSLLYQARCEEQPSCHDISTPSPHFSTIRWRKWGGLTQPNAFWPSRPQHLSWVRGLKFNLWTLGHTIDSSQFTFHILGNIVLKCHSFTWHHNLTVFTTHIFQLQIENHV